MVKLIKRIYHHPFEGRTHTDFPCNGYRNGGGLHIKSEPSAEIKRLLLKVDYTGSSYKEKNQLTPTPN
jgi:hypothetical protein